MPHGISWVQLASGDFDIMGVRDEVENWIGEAIVAWQMGDYEVRYDCR